jgi:hypothetical protein
MCQAPPIYRTTAPPAGGCFVAGTVVHTKNGLVSIEKIRVGHWVLSQPEMKGELAYRQVVNTVSFEDKEVWLVEYFLYHEKTARRLVVTGNQPFWGKDVGWTAAEHLSPGQDLELRDGTAACVFKVRRIFKTETPDVGWTGDDHTNEGPTIDLRGGKVQVSEPFAGDTANEFALEAQEYLKRQVFNIDVDGFHTYYAGEAGIWVHNTG